LAGDVGELVGEKVRREDFKTLASLLSVVRGSVEVVVVENG
jgi:hypothetical protein